MPRKMTEKPTPGFAIRLTDDTDLSFAFLIAEDEEGRYEPVDVVSTISEARELAESNMRVKRERMENGEDPGLCPYVYRLWARGLEGVQTVAAMFVATDL